MSLYSRRAIGIVLVVAGLLIGSVLVAPRVGFAAPVVQSRAVSCSTSAFRPIDYGTLYTIGSARVLYRPGSGGSSSFRCDPGIPHNAVVTKFQVTGADYTTQASMGACSLNRMSLEAATAGDIQAMASTAATDVAGQPGTVRLTDDSISFATVKNGLYAYFISCSIGTDPSAGPIGASVTFNISSANG